MNKLNVLLANLLNAWVSFRAYATNARLTNLSNLNAPISDIVSAIELTGKSRSQVFTANGTWTKPTNVSAVRIVLVGGGGGGGGGTSGHHGGPGSGGEVKDMEVPVDADVEIVIGPGGSGGNPGSTGQPGSTGTASSFGAITALPGVGGNGATSTSNGTPGDPGRLGSGPSSSWNISGYGVGAADGTGGASYTDGPSVGVAATANTGAGGGGGNASAAGKPGGSGKCIVFWTE